MLKFNIRVSNTTLTPTIEDYVSKKVEALEKYTKNDSAANLYVELSKTTAHHKHGDVFRAEFNLHTSGQQMFAAAENADLYAAIDEVKDEVLEELRGAKGKRLTLLKRGHQKVKDFIRGIRSKR